MELQHADLVAPLRRCLDDARPVATAWTVEELSGSFGNPATRGVYRVTGTATVGGEPTSWSMVLKIHFDPATAARPHMGSAPDHWNHWRREQGLHASGFFEQLPDAFSVPRSYGVEERPDGTVWNWSEDVRDLGVTWDRDRFEDVARRTGRFNGAFLAGRPIPSQAVCPDFVGSWLATLDDLYPYLADPVDRRAFWEHPGVVRLLGPPATNPLLRFDAELDRHRSLLARLPRTLCHHDVSAVNVLWPSADRCVLIDWGIVGPDAVGTDLATLTMSAAEHGVDGLFEPYLAGLREAGWDAPTDLVRYGVEAALVVRAGYLLVSLLHGVPVLLDPVWSRSAGAALITPERVEAAAGLAALTVDAAAAALGRSDPVERLLASVAD